MIGVIGIILALLGILVLVHVLLWGVAVGVILLLVGIALIAFGYWGPNRPTGRTL